ncbi:alanine dehydrogenase [Methyloprofundus sedimenti]|uniref:Alanine dehydrogenase n=1 Tax=Methyloprofundus sedimenti TaxID=1420851 RepID=A0A1V8M144_9GAMM|nr:alanine dehydrogenase [Methyloprofundus sedimenti]OQK15281.1 alanine dehydrogenase [Methyloprofundus sedimenti]
MIIGVPKEIKIQEYRVAIIPSGVAELVRAGHKVLIERGAGVGSAYTDQEYEQNGAKIVSTKEAWATQLVVKVKEPLSSEYHYLQGQILFTFLHLAGVEKELTRRLLTSGTTAIAYETLEDEQGRLPLLAPMSAIAGNMAALVGAYYLAKYNNGNGVQLGKVLGTRHGKALVIGDGVVGSHAAHTLNGMGANVFQSGLSELKSGMQLSGELEGVEYFFSTAKAIAKNCIDADLVIGAVLNKGAKAPYIVTEEMVKSMRKGTVIVDVSIDQGGCIETSRATTHDSPVYLKHGVTHYCVTNMPGAYPRTSTMALCAETLMYIHLLADKGVSGICAQANVSKAINIYKSRIVNQQIATSLNMLETYISLNELCE